MILRPIACLAGLLVLAAMEPAWAGPKEVVQKIEDLNKAALASFKAGDAQKAKSQLMEAVVLGKEKDLDTHPIMASTYLHLGVVHVDGLNDPEKAQRYFSLARRI